MLGLGGGPVARKPPDWEARVRAMGLMPVHADWTGVAALTPAHDVVYAPDDEPGAVRPVEDARERNWVLYEASRRYPELAHLRPERGPGDRTCPQCGGSGIFPLPAAVDPEQRIVCYCGGLGWLPAGYVDPHVPDRDQGV